VSLSVFCLGSLGRARSAQQNTGSSVASARSVHLSSAESERTCKECTPEGFTDSKEASRLLNTLEGGTVQRKAQKRNRTTEGSVKLCQEGIERVHRVHQRTLF
jgi:hypothetical protein